MSRITCTVNGTRRDFDASPVTRLSEALRTSCGLTGTKSGCDAGDCGACSVLIDGDVACACLTAVSQVQDTDIRTVEGLADNGRLDRLQESFLAFGAAQCGICTPGMLVSARALLDRNPRPARQDVEDALGGVLCRCTGYRKIVDAVLDAAGGNEHPGAANGSAPPLSGEAVGHRLRHVDGLPKVDGSLHYGADTLPEDAVLVRVVRSPHHHARFRFGDLDAWTGETPGIHRVFTAADITGTNAFGVIAPFADQPVFAEGTARFRGEAVAAIAGEPEAIRRLRIEDFPVTWEPLDHTLLPGDALAENAPQVHDDRPGNVLVRGLVERGDPETAIAGSAHVVTLRTSTPFIEHAYIEPEAGYAKMDGERFVIHGCTQSPHMDREALAGVLGVEQSEIRIVPSACGGGFGSKLDLSIQPYIALAARALRRPAVICYTRSESMQSTTKRHPSEITLTAGCDKTGRLTGFDFSGRFNTGAYASWGPTVANRVPVHASGPYLVPDYRAKSLAVHTNAPPSGAFRGFGVPQSAVAQESAFDELAIACGMDRLEFRIRNALRDGQPTVTGQVFETGIGIHACLEALRPAWTSALERVRDANRGANGAPLRRGIGVASCWYGCGNTSLPNPSTILMGVTADGRPVIHQGAVDIGQGSNTVILQIAADALGIPVHALERLGADTDITPDAGKTSASRQTYVSGKAAMKAAQSLRAAILRHANVGENSLIRFENGRILLDDGEGRAEIDTTVLPADETGYVFSACESYDPPITPLDAKGQGNPYAVYGYGAQMVELTVDTGLGTVRLDRITAAHDVGRAINPLLVEGQVEGGIAQGIGLALMEDFRPGVTENLHDYLIPTMGDVPDIETIIVEVADTEGPYGAKGLGEHVLIPTAPAILNAIRDATGARICDLPATPDKVLSAIRAVDRGASA